jgi:microcystin degradation protein MlrC
MKRILIAECSQEIASFNPVPSQLESFRLATPAQLFAEHRSLRTEIAGALHHFDSRTDIELVPGFGARSITSGGTTSAAAWKHISESFLDAIRSAHAAAKLDGIYFCLHGSMGADDQLDPEGYLLVETRKIVGEQIPIVASFDLHGVITDPVLKNCDSVTVYHTYPHIDLYETGERSAKLLLKIMDGKAKPVTVRARIPALVRGDELKTKTGIFGKRVAEAVAVENSATGLSAGIFIGNPFTDVPDVSSNVIISTNDDEKLAVDTATKIAAEFWRDREKMQAFLTSVPDAVAQACAAKSGTTILVDAADATSSGACGDSNVVLAELIKQGYSGTVLAPLTDAPAVAAAFKAGIGNTVTTNIGGSLDPRYTPIEVTGQVQMLSDGEFNNEAEGEPWHAGNCAVLKVKNITLVLISKPVNFHNRSLFFAHGLFPEKFDLVIVKSPHCQDHMYANWATTYINVDAPGSTSANLPSLGHTICRRPIFPLDANVEYVPEITVYRR